MLTRVCSQDKVESVRRRQWSDMVKDDDRSQVMKQIDANLRKVYQETLEQEIPERFQQLLERLKERDSGDDRG